MLALGALQALASRGLSTPADVSVCGFDDIPAAKAANLTTVHQPIREKGLHVGRLLIDPESRPRQVLLPIRFVLRGTTGPAPTAPLRRNISARVAPEAPTDARRDLLRGVVGPGGVIAQRRLVGQLRDASEQLGERRRAQQC